MPAFISLHINDLPSVVSSKVKLLTDDCLIYRNIKNKQDQIKLQKDLNLMWGVQWGMHLNTTSLYGSLIYTFIFFKSLI